MTTQKPVVYLAGPLGFSETGRVFHNHILVPMLEEIGFKVLDPWVLTPQGFANSALKLPSGKARKERWQEVNRIIGRNNANAIEESDIIVAVLDGVDVDSGTASEIGYGVALGKIVIGYRSDYRLSGENEGCVVNMQVEYFIYRNSGEIVTKFKELRKSLVKFHKRFISVKKV